MAGNFTSEIEAITIVYITSLIPSVIGSFSVLLVSLLRWRNLQEQNQLLVQLALADLLASVLLLMVTSTNLTKYSGELCRYGLPLALVFYILSFTLAIFYAHKSKNVLQGWRSRPADCEDAQSGGELEKVFYVLLWLTFGGMYIIYALYTKLQCTTDFVKQTADFCRSCLLFSHKSTDSCPSDSPWLRDPLYYILFLMALVVIVFCTVSYRQVSTWYTRQQQQQQGLFPVEGDGQSRKRFKRVKYTTVRMVLVVVFCWTPAFVLFVLTFKIDQDKLFPLYIIQAMTVSLQGFLNSMVYAWKRPNFTEAVLGERTPLITYHQRAFFEESLKTSV